MPFGTLAIRDLCVKILRRSSQGYAFVGGLNPRGVAEYSDLDLSNAISRKRCKIGAKLLLITNRKSHAFDWYQNRCDLDDHERRNTPMRSVISPNSVNFRTDCVKVVEDRPILSAAEM